MRPRPLSPIRLRRQSAHQGRPGHHFDDLRIVDLPNPRNQPADGQLAAFVSKLSSEGLDAAQLQQVQPFHPSLRHAFRHRTRQSGLGKPRGDPALVGLRAAREGDEEQRDQAHKRQVSGSPP